MDDTTRAAALEPLNALIGAWSIEAVFPQLPPSDVLGRMEITWVDGQHLMQRSEVPVPEAPDATSIITLNHDGNGFTQHYFDSRGVVRVYAMTLADGVWTLLRTTPDFTPLSFCQRYVGTFSAAGDRIDGAWETSPDGASWTKDFDLSYHRIA